MGSFGRGWSWAKGQMGNVGESATTAYYGSAAQPMIEYIRQTQDLAHYQGTARKYLRRRPGFHQSGGRTAYMKPSAVRKWQTLIDLAEEQAAELPMSENEMKQRRKELAQHGM